MSAYMALNGPESIYKVVLEQDERRVDRSKRQTILNQIVSNHHFNCHGYAFLDGQFWFELNAKKIALILEEDEYVPCSFNQLKEEGICVYYKSNGALLHSAVLRNGDIRSKFGINKTMTMGEKDILNKYKKIDHSKTKYYNPA